jgi:putative ABC transport system permease protein
MSKDVKVLTRKELADLELNYWKRNSSVGFIFSLGVLVGFVVGSIIVYQILFGDVMNSLPQYATLKAMGYTDRYVISVVIQQSAILAFVGFIPGVITSMGLYWLLATVTKLSVFMTTTRALQVLLLTFVMCVGSGALATRKLVQLDPADVF